jgi:guanylate kinase
MNDAWNPAGRPRQQVDTMSGTLVIVSGPSGVGKTTICKRLVEELNAYLSVSCTTRPRRDNEVDGQDYRFISRQEFERQLERGAFLEYAEVYGGQCYGTPAEPVWRALGEGRVVILEIDIEGTIQAVRRYPDAISVYILPPTPGDLQGRLVGRQKDSAEAIRERLGKADGEIRYAYDCGAYRHFLVNDTVEETVEAIVEIVKEKRGA